MRMANSIQHSGNAYKVTSADYGLQAFTVHELGYANDYALVPMSISTINLEWMARILASALKVS